MSRKRKTKKEKITSDLKNELHKNQNDSSSDTKYNFSSENEFDKKGISLNFLTLQKNNSLIQNKEILTKNYSYVLHDIKKTISVVFIVFLINFALFILLEKNILSLKFLGL